MINVSQQRLLIGLVAASFFAFHRSMMVPAQQLDTTSVIHQVNAAVKARIDNLAGYSVTEHYAVFRGQDEIHPVAEMTVIDYLQEGNWKELLDRLAFRLGTGSRCGFGRDSRE